MYLLVSVASRFTTAALTFILADINQHLVPPLVLTCSSGSPRYMSGGFDLSPFSLNTHLIPLIVFMGKQLITSTLST